MELTFDQLPKAVTTLQETVNDIKRLLLAKSSEPQPEPDRWLDLTELCNYLPDKPVKPTVYGWVHNALIPCHKKGKKLFFLKSEIDSWLKQGRKLTTSEAGAVADNYVNRKRG